MNTKPPSMLWHVMVQVTLLCISLAGMFHYHHVQQLLCDHVWNNWMAWRAVGFTIPALFVSSMVLYLEWRSR